MTKGKDPVRPGQDATDPYVVFGLGEREIQLDNP